MRKMVLVLYFALSMAALADSASSTWSLSLNCNNYGISGSGSFTFTSSTLNGSAGSCARTSTFFTELSTGPTTGSTTVVHSTVFALHTTDVLIVPPFATGQTQPIFAVAPSTVASAYTANWIVVQWPNSQTLTNTYLIGQAYVNPAAPAGGNGVTLTGQWDIDGSTYFMGNVNMPGTWSAAGVYNSTGTGGPSDLSGIAYFSSSGAGAFKTSTSDATFFFPQPQNPIPQSSFSGRSMAAISFDTLGTVYNLGVTANAAGTQFTVTPYSNVITGTINATFTDTISLPASSANTPANGVFLGTVTRTGTGAGTGNIACLADITGVARLICSGQSPNNNTIPYNISMVADGLPPSSLYYSDSSPSAGSAIDLTAVIGSPGATVIGCSLVSGTLPPGLSLDPVTCNLSGTPSQVGNFTFTLAVNNGVGVQNLSQSVLVGGSGYITRVAGGGTFSSTTMTANYGNIGDGSSALSAGFMRPQGITQDSAGNIYLADTGNSRVRMIPATNGTYFGQTMTAYNVYTIAGSPSWFSGSGENVPAVGSTLNYPGGIAVDGAGNLYIANMSGNNIRMVPKSSGTYFGISMTANRIYTIAGSSIGASGPSGNGGPATSAKLYNPTGIALDNSGNLYIANCGANQVNMVPIASGTYFGQSMTANYIYDIAGKSAGGAGFAGDNAIATSAKFRNPWGVAIDRSGNVFISDQGNHRIRMVPNSNATYSGNSVTAGYIYTIAGGSTAGFAGDGGPASSAQLYSPEGIHFDAAGNLTITDYTTYKIRVIAGLTGNFFGTSVTAGYIYSYSGGLSSPCDAFLDPSTNLYIADTENNRILFVPSTSGTYFGQTMTAQTGYLIAGLTAPTNGISGVGGVATNSLLSAVSGLTYDSSGNLYFADGHARVLMIPKGSGTYFGQSMTANYLYVIAGNTMTGNAGDGGPATSANVGTVDALATDGSGNLYIADTSNHRIQMVPQNSGTYFGQSMTANYMYTIAGSASATSGSTGDGGAATSALLNTPEGVAVDAAGNVYIADQFNDRIQMVPASNGTFFGQSMTANFMYTIAGTTGTPGAGSSVGLGGPASSILLFQPAAVTVDASGNVIVCDTGNNRVLALAASTGTFFHQSMTAGNVYALVNTNGVPGPSGNGGPATSGGLYYPTGAAVDTSGNLYIDDRLNNRLQMVPHNSGTYFGQSMTANYVYTLIGSPTYLGYFGDNGLISNASVVIESFGTYSSVSVAPSGNVVFSDDNSVRLLFP